MFRPGEAAEIIGVDVNTLRDWRRRGFIDLKKSPQEAAHPRYSPHDLADLILVNRLSIAGLSLSGAFRLRAQYSYLMGELLASAARSQRLYVWLSPEHPGEPIQWAIGPMATEQDFEDGLEVMIVIDLSGIVNRVRKADRGGRDRGDGAE